MAPVPRTRYASCGEIDIAYQVFGDGPIDLLVLPGPLIPIDCVDLEPSMYRFHRRLASFCRVIRFDQRGIGLSSRVPSLDTIGPKSWAKDAIAVMNAVGCERATIFAPGFTSLAGLVLAVDYPERVSSLVIVNGAARTLRAPDYPIGTEVSAADPFTTIGIEPDAVEQGFDVLGIIAPSVAGDDAFRSWWDMAGNRAASPSMARAFIKKIREADVRDTLDRVAVPTLILHRDNPSFSPVAHAHYLAERIAGSRFVELPGEDTLYWVGDTSPMLDEIEEFVTGARGTHDPDRILATVMFTDIVSSTEHAARLGDRRWQLLMSDHDELFSNQISVYRGRTIRSTGDGVFASFDGPARAIRCALSLVDAARRLDVEIRAGLHTGECELAGDDLAGVTVHIGARIADLAEPHQVLVSGTVRDLVVGSNIPFRSRGVQALKGVPGEWPLYMVDRPGHEAPA
jgi:class 3 adenylate cyclase